MNDSANATTAADNTATEKSFGGPTRSTFTAPDIDRAEQAHRHHQGRMGLAAHSFRAGVKAVGTELIERLVPVLLRPSKGEYKGDYEVAVGIDEAAVPSPTGNIVLKGVTVKVTLKGEAKGERT